MPQDIKPIKPPVNSEKGFGPIKMDEVMKGISAMRGAPKREDATEKPKPEAKKAEDETPPDESSERPPRRRGVEDAKEPENKRSNLAKFFMDESARVEISDDNDSEDSGEDDPKKDDEGDGEADAKPDKKESGVDDDEEPIRTDDVPAGPAIKAKFKAFNGRIKDLKTKREADLQRIAELESQLTEAKKTAPSEQKIEDHPQYAALLKQLEEKEQTISRVSIEQSDDFKKRFTQPINAKFNDLKSSVNKIRDVEVKKATAILMDTAINATHDEAGAEVFDDALGQIIENNDIPQLIRARLQGQLEDIRAKMLERSQAVENWKSTSEEIEKSRADELGKSAVKVLAVFDQSAATAEASDHHKMAVAFRQSLGVDKVCDTLTKSDMEVARKHLESAVRTGKISIELMELVRRGANIQAQNVVINRLAEVAQKLAEERQKGDKAKKEKDNTDPMRIGKNGAPKRDDQTERSYPKGRSLSGMVGDAIRQAG